MGPTWGGGLNRGRNRETATIYQGAGSLQRRAGGWLQPFVVMCRTNKVSIASQHPAAPCALAGRTSSEVVSQGLKKDLLKPSIIMKQQVDFLQLPRLLESQEESS